jgi:hypothetical protein
MIKAWLLRCLRHPRERRDLCTSTTSDLVPIAERLTARQARDLAGICRDTWERLVRDGKAQPVPVARSPDLRDARALTDWIYDRKNTPTTEEREAARIWVQENGERVQREIVRVDNCGVCFQTFINQRKKGTIREGRDFVNLPVRIECKNQVRQVPPGILLPRLRAKQQAFPSVAHRPGLRLPGQSRRETFFSCRRTAVRFSAQRRFFS